MNTQQYLTQIILCLVTVAAIPFALTKKRIRKSVRIAVACCPIVYGSVYYWATDDTSGIYAALMGAVVLLTIILHPGQPKNEEEVQE